jgi:hypothetical protein
MTVHDAEEKPKPILLYPTRMEPITLESLLSQNYTKKQIQDENVRLGLARCENELKSKSIRKLRDYLESQSVPVPIPVEEKIQEVSVRKSIPKKIRAEVWKAHFGRSTDGFCVCCRCSLGILDEWHAGHIVAHAKGGLDDATNLRPVCGPCNRSMGTESMSSFIARCYPLHVL